MPSPLGESSKLSQSASLTQAVPRWWDNTVKATVARYSFEPGRAFPLHRHPQEQLTFVQSGTVEFVAGATRARWTSAETGLSGVIDFAKDCDFAKTRKVEDWSSCWPD